MTLNPPPTIESFYKLCAEKKLMGVRCGRCGKLTVPPRSVCTQCGSIQLAWTELPNTGKLVTYTIIHIAPPRFQSLTPYAVGIVEFPERVRLPGMISNVKHEELKVGMALRIGFDTAIPDDWPRWPRYFFEPT